MFSIALLLSACKTTPFGPIAIPEYTSIRPTETRNLAAISRELEELQHTQESSYIISPNDVFSLIVYGHSELNRNNLLVTPDGSVNISPIGAVKLSGLSLDAANQLLSEKFSEYLRTPNITLEPIEIRGYTYTISGKVNMPGIYPISIGFTRLSDAIATAKGLAQGTFRSDTIDLADLDNAYIIRQGKILPVDFVKAITMGDPLNNIPLKNGDYIYIPATVSGNITILGEVHHPTYLPYTKDISVLQALGYAGGIKATHYHEIKVIRGGLKNPEVFTMNISNMLLGRSADFQLQPRDIIYIPRDNISDWNVIIEELLPTVQLLNGLAGPFGNPIYYGTPGYY